MVRQQPSYLADCGGGRRIEPFILLLGLRLVPSLLRDLGVRAALIALIGQGDGYFVEARLRYDLTQLGPDKTKVTLTYDWSAVGPVTRQHIHFPPFAPGHLDNSLSHLAALVAR